jgi:hypothetical protein
MAMTTSRSNMLPTVCLDEPHELSNLHSFQFTATKAAGNTLQRDNAATAGRYISGVNFAMLRSR